MHKKLLQLLAGFTLIALASCKGKTEETPAYIHIEKIDFTYDNISTVGNGGTAITDAWVYENDNVIGVFELPATIAVATSGKREISVRPGIKLNGISATREHYRYYQGWSEDINIIPLDTVTIEPFTKYYNTTMLSFHENFEDVVIKFDSSSNSDVSLERTKIINPEPQYLENYVGLATMTASKPYFKCFTKDAFMVPVTSPLPIYLELDYKCNTDFTVSTLIKSPSNGVYEDQVITLRSTVVNGEMIWKHIYIDFTDSFIGQIDATGFGFSFTSAHNSSNTESFLYLDNTKVVNSN